MPRFRFQAALSALTLQTTGGAVSGEPWRAALSLAFAAKQAYAQFVFQCFDLLADRALCHAQLLRRLGEALLASAGLEGLECIEGRQAASHSVLQFIRKTRPYRRKDALRERSVCLDNLVNGGRFLMVGSSI